MKCYCTVSNAKITFLKVGFHTHIIGTKSATISEEIKDIPIQQESNKMVFLKLIILMPHRPMFNLEFDS